MTAMEKKVIDEAFTLMAKYANAVDVAEQALKENPPQVHTCISKLYMAKDHYHAAMCWAEVLPKPQ